MKPFNIMLAVFVSLLWGGNFIAAKYGVGYFPPFLFTAMRFVLVSLILLPFVPRPTMDQLKRIAPISLLAALHFSFMFAALAYGLEITSCALVGQLGVPFACILGAIFLGDRLGKWRITGIIVAFSGVFIVSGTPNILVNQAAFFFALANAFAWACGNIFVKRVSEMDALQLLAWMSVGTVPVLLAAAFIFEPTWPSFAAAPMSAWMGLAYTSIASTVMAYGIWYYLLKTHTVSQIAPISLLTPVFGISLGHMFFSESITQNIIIGGTLTIVGVAIIVMRRPKLAIFGRPS